MLFTDLDLVPEILTALKKQGYTTPTPIQEQSIPHILEWRDVLGAAQTGTGKTAAFSIPTLQILSQEKKLENTNKAIKCLILTPTRELAIQIEESLNAYGKWLDLKHTVIFGWVPQNPQVKKLKAGVDILVATPGRLLDLVNQGFIDLSHVKIFTLDEADRMLDMWFIHDMRKVLALIPKQRQTLFFSATMPKDISHLADDILDNPIKVEVTPVSSTADTVSQAVFFVNKMDKISLLTTILNNKKMEQVLVFTRTKHGADRVVRQLAKVDIRAEAIHGNKTQNNRQRALKNFKSWKTRVLIATDIAARGIDIDELMFVINYDTPNESETYVHRIGRTGRAGNDGVALSFCDREEFEFLLDIEKLIGKKIKRMENHPDHIEITRVLNKQERRELNREKNERKKMYRREAMELKRNKKRR